MSTSATMDQMGIAEPAAPPRVPSLGRRTARGGAIVLVSTGTNRLINLAITAVLARILSPAEYGQIGMVFTLTFIIGVFNDLGLTTATIQKADLQQAEASAAFWLNLVFGTILCGVTMALAPALVAFYHEPALLSLTCLCAVCFPIAAMGSQHIAMIVRRMQFERVALCDLVNIIVGGTIGVVMAKSGFGVKALAGQLIAGTAANATMAWLLSGWAPSLPRWHSGVRGILKFGGYLTGFNIVNYLSRNFDNVLVGRACGSDALGLYTRAYALMMYPIAFVSAPLSRVALPALSQFQSDHARMRDAYVRILSVIGFITFPMMTLLFALADDVIAVVYGRKWVAAAPLFRILCIAGIYQGIYNAAGQVLTASGRTDRMMRLGVFIAAVLCSAFLIGIHWNAEGVATAYVIGSGLTLIPYLRYTYSTVGLNMRDAITPLLPTLAAALVAGAAAIAFQKFAGAHWPAIARLLLSATFGGAVYLSILLVIWREQLERLISQAAIWFRPKTAHA